VLPWWRYAIGGVFLSLAQCSDTITLYVGLAPIIGVSLLRIRARRECWRSEAPLLAVCAGALVVTAIFRAVVAHANGFVVSPYAGNDHASIIDLEHLGENLRYTVQGLMRLYYGDFSGCPLGPVALVLLAGFGGFLMSSTPCAASFASCGRANATERRRSTASRRSRDWGWGSMPSATP